MLAGLELRRLWRLDVDMRLLGEAIGNDDDDDDMRGGNNQVKTQKRYRDSFSGFHLYKTSSIQIHNMTITVQQSQHTCV